jgi:hypothetical protein
MDAHNLDPDNTAASESQICSVTRCSNRVKARVTQ